MVVRTVLDTIGGPTVVVNATGCLEVATTRYPTTAWNVPWLHVAFENAAAVASGVESALPRAPPAPCAARRRRRHVRRASRATAAPTTSACRRCPARSSAATGFLFVCYDNEAYMNTGIQRSGATPFAASTTTSPAGLRRFGKAQKRKDLTAIAVAHHIPYVAQAAGGSHWHDLSVKARRAAAAEGPAFLNVLTDCPVGWGHEPRLGPRVLNAAVECLLLAALRGGRRPVSAHLRAAEAAARQGVPLFPGALLTSGTGRDRARASRDRRRLGRARRALRLVVVPKEVVHPGLAGGWSCQAPSPGGPDEASR